MEVIPGYEKGAGWLWYILIFFTGIIGGIIGFIYFYNKNRKTAWTLLIVSLILTIVFTVFSLPAKVFIR